MCAGNSNARITLAGMVSHTEHTGSPLALAPIDEAQRLLGGVSRRTVLRLLDSGELVRVRVRGRVLVDPDSIRRYIERHREPV
jgi:excisionase family DNA binding protein